MAIARGLDAPRAGSIDDALSGRLGWRAVRDIAAEPSQHGVGPLLAACGAPTSDLVLTRTKYKPGRKLTAHYRSRPVRDGRPWDIAVRWHATPPSTDGGRDSAGAYAGDRPSTSVATSADGRVSLLVAPADPAMPQLERLHRREHLTSVLARMDGQPSLADGALDVETIRYRPGERHVLRVTATERNQVLFVKTDKDGSGARAVLVARAVAAALARRCPDAGVAEPVGYAPGDSAAVWRRAAGRPLSRGSDEGGRRVAPFRLLGRAVRVIHDDIAGQSPVGAGELLAGAARTGQDEATATLRAGEHITALLPSTGSTYQALVARIVDELEHRSVEPPTLIHGDLKGDNILTTGVRIHLLDFDRASLGDPALDLGKFIADLRWMAAGDGRPADYLIAAFRSGYGPCDETRWARARLMAVLFQLKFAARRLAIHDDWWSQRVHARILDAATVLERKRVTA